MNETTTYTLPVAKGESIEIDVERYVFDGSTGRGLARYRKEGDDGPGFAVFIPGALPGQRVRARIDKVKKNHAVAKLTTVLEPAPGQTDPACAHFAACGGCMLAPLPYEEQLACKRSMVRDALRGVASPDELEALVGKTIPAPEPWRSRNKIELAFSGRADGLHLGFHPVGSPRSVVNVVDCHLMPGEGVERILEAVRRFARESGVAAWKPDTRGGGRRPGQSRGKHGARFTGTGYWRHLVIRRNDAGELLALIITTPDTRHAHLLPELAERIQAAAAGAGTSVTVIHGTRAANSGVARPEREVVLAGPGHLTERIGACTFRISSASFFQTNTGVAARLLAQVRDATALTGTERVLDLYCGSGAIGLSLAPHAHSVVGVETDAAAVADARAAAQAASIANARFVTGDAADVAGAMPGTIDVVVVDPPRPGLTSQTTDGLAHLQPQRIVYVSCNPATLARDAQRLAPSYTLTRAVPVDMFPQTAHVEVVALLERVEGG